MAKNIFAAMFAGRYFSYCEGYLDFEVHKIVYIRDVDPELRLCNYYIEKVWAAPPSHLPPSWEDHNLNIIGKS